MSDEKPPPHPLADPNFRDQRSLYLEDWATLVRPFQDDAHRFVGHSATYGSTALQAAYIINGGALAALPALVTSLTTASASAIATAAIPFIFGIASAAISSLSAYLNFQWQAQISWFDANENAVMLRQFYERSGDPPDKAVREKFATLVNCSLYAGVAAALASLAFFVWGAWQFIELARSTMT
jgi:hypothetical protein